MSDSHVRNGDLVTLDIGDGCGDFVAIVLAKNYRYSHADGAEHTVVDLEDCHGNDRFTLTIDELAAARRRAEIGGQA